MASLPQRFQPCQGAGAAAEPVHLQTEALANEVAQRVVTRESLANAAANAAEPDGGWCSTADFSYGYRDTYRNRQPQCDRYRDGLANRDPNSHPYCNSDRHAYRYSS